MSNAHYFYGFFLIVISSSKSLQLNQAQLRAALGLTQVDDLSAYLQAQQRQQHDIQRDQQIRQLLLQEQLGQHVQEHQLRAIGDQLQDFPDLQHHYQNLLLSEQINRRREQVAQAQLRYQEELRRQQLGGVISIDEVSRSNSPNLSTHSSPAVLAAALRAQQQSPVPMLPTAQLAPKPITHQMQPQPTENRIAVATALVGLDEKSAPVVPKETKKKRSVSDEAVKKPKAKRARKVDMKPPPDDNSVTVVDVTGESDLLEQDPLPPKGTMEMLLEATDTFEKMEQGASFLLDFMKSKVNDWSDTTVSQENEPMKFSVDPNESITTSRFKSELPLLPSEPAHDDFLGQPPPAPAVMQIATPVIRKADTNDTVPESNGKKSERKKVLAIVEPTVPIDTWWPSVNGMRRERHAAGETSDEDNFKEAVVNETCKFRANDQKIRKRLSSLAEPGCLEKLPHCKFHRVHSKSGQSEFAYCFQVTELYPNEMMVCCSKCGTWRHPACGGHYENYSIRKNTKEPFVAICDFCHEEARFLEEFPRAAERIEGQRMVQLRRALATSAVMRQASYSRHGGTYKWPLGSVSASHIGGHTRSVVARHEKAEKQWSDTVQRLGRGYGYRAKDRARSRTKEFERLLMSIEDAEAYTDRHNMLHFLMRDTVREKPVGFEKEFVNIFDPDNSFGTKESTQWKRQEKSSPCVRNGCFRARRFDSLFCSDACGVSVIETDVMESLFESSEIHPCILRS